MNILLVGNYPFRSDGVFQGPMRVLHNLAQALSEHDGISVMVAAPHRFMEFWKRPVVSHEAGPRVVRFSGLSFVWYLLTDRTIDVVNIHGISWFNALALVKRLFGHSRVFFTAHGFTPLESPLGYRYSALSKLCERWLIRFSDKIITVCEDTRMAICREMSVADSRTEVIGNGVDIRKFSPVDSRSHSDQNSGKIKILFVGDTVRGKGTDLLVKAAEKIKSGSFILRMAGRDSEFFQKIRSDFKPFFGRGPVCYLGALDQQDLIREYRNSDFCVFPSRYDQYPQAVLESMASGKPVIISDSMGIRCELANGREGLIFRSENADALAEAMDRMIRDPDLRRTMGIQARKKAKSLSWKKISERYLDVFGENEK
jgi:glycosyltransferase involved in cell wall biosynthesis